VVELTVPPLRERRGDIPLLAREFARKYSERFGLGYVAQLAPELIEDLEQQPWPGNIRQLENTIARCVALATTCTIGREALLAPIDSTDSTDQGPSFRVQVESFERNLIRKVMQASGGNMSETARRLRLNRATLYDRMKKYGMTKE